MTDFCCCDSDNFIAKTKIPLKRKQLSLAKPCEKATLSPSKRFIRTERGRSAEGLQRLMGTSCFPNWAHQQKKRCKEVCPRDLLDKPYSPEEICDCLQRFVAEARRGDGTPYPARTFYQILCGLSWHSREIQPKPPNFLDRKDARFKKLLKREKRFLSIIQNMQLKWASVVDVHNRFQ